MNSSEHGTYMMTSSVSRDAGKLFMSSGSSVEAVVYRQLVVERINDGDITTALKLCCIGHQIPFCREKMNSNQSISDVQTLGDTFDQLLKIESYEQKRSEFLSICDEWYRLLEPRGLMSIEQKELLKEWISTRQYANTDDPIVSLVIDKCLRSRIVKEKQEHAQARETEMKEALKQRRLENRAKKNKDRGSVVDTGIPIVDTKPGASSSRLDVLHSMHSSPSAQTPVPQIRDLVQFPLLVSGCYINPGLQNYQSLFSSSQSCPRGFFDPNGPPVNDWNIFVPHASTTHVPSMSQFIYPSSMQSGIHANPFVPSSSNWNQLGVQSSPFSTMMPSDHPGIHAVQFIHPSSASVLPSSSGLHYAPSVVQSGIHYVPYSSAGSNSIDKCLRSKIVKEKQEQAQARKTAMKEALKQRRLENRAKKNKDRGSVVDTGIPVVDMKPGASSSKLDVLHSMHSSPSAQTPVPQIRDLVQFLYQVVPLIQACRIINRCTVHRSRVLGASSIRIGRPSTIGTTSFLMRRLLMFHQ